MVSLRSVRGIFIPSSIQEELTKKQSVRTLRIVTRSLKGGFGKPTLLLHFGWSRGAECCRPY